MEKWQIDHITHNLKQLTELTTFHTLLKAKLTEKEILSKADVEKLDAVQRESGNLEASRHGYQMLLTRKGAYKVLYEALKELNQSGAFTILIKVPNEVVDKLFPHASIEIHGKTFKIKDFFPAADYKFLQQVFRKCLTELEFYDIFVTEENGFEIASNTIPLSPSYYVPRFLSNRIKIDESIFKAAITDVFVFKKSMPRHKLSQLATPQSTDTSTSQLNNITSRFIHLDDNEDWTELKKKTILPIHLIHYDASGKHFLLEDSSAPSGILKRLGSKEERVYMSEEEFVQQQLSVDCASSSVCICDTPGMGKTLLLENIARRMADKCAGTIVMFIKLTLFTKDFFPGSLKTPLEPEMSLTNLLSYICPPRQNSELLLTLVKAKILRLEIFFDGFDEIPNEQIEWTKEVFRAITTSYPKMRIYITSRPHMRQELEKSLGVAAYDILPFNQENQVDFLVQFWKNRKADASHLSLQTKATKCLKVVNDSLTNNEKDIAGIPLLCMLIAEVYSAKVAFRLIEKGRVLNVSHNISGMYQAFIENKIKLVTKDETKSKNIKIVHIWHSIKLLFPTNGFHEDKQFETVNDLLTSPDMLRVGILQKHLDGTLEFIHRTFAEYLVANYLFDKLMEIQKGVELNCDSMSILRLLLCCQKSKDEDGNRYRLFPHPLDSQQRHTKENYDFVHPVIVSFFNSAPIKDEISDELKIQGAAFVSSISQEECIGILCECCKHNLVNLFCLLTERLKTCENSQIVECFTNENSYELLSVCIKKSSILLFRKCSHFLVEKLKLDLNQINTFGGYNTLLHTAVRYVNYEAVEYFVGRISLKNQSLLFGCVSYSYGMKNIEERISILNLLHDKDHTLIHETPRILIIRSIDLSLFKILVEFGANLTTACETYGNCVMSPAEYMSPSDFHELVQFLLTDRKAEYLFIANEKWRDPLPVIIGRATLLPETLDMLLNIPGNNINMKDKDGENLLFTAAKGDNLVNLQQLVKRGLDHNVRGRWNRSLLHLAAMEWGGTEMILYLLSLKLDPNSHDENKWTPLHQAACCNKLSNVRVLLKNGANIQAKTNDGRTALHISAEVSLDKKIIKYLIEKGLGVNDRDKYGNTPLHFCSEKEAIDCLVEMGADFFAKNANGQSILHIFTKNKYPDKKFIEYLIGKGAGVNDRDNEGNAPIHLCINGEAIDCLVEMGADIHAKNKMGQTPAQMKPDLWK